MDLSQGVRQLQGMHRAGPAPTMLDMEGASGRVNPLSQMDLRMLQNGLLGRSSSLADMSPPSRTVMPPCGMELPQGNTNSQFQLSGNAVLVGTVAALQEESGQLRSQWKSDVSRLERELAQLRSAAAWALPQLGEAQKQPELLLRTDSNLQALVIPSQGGLTPMQQAQQLMLMQGAGAERSLPMMQALNMQETCASVASPAPYTARTATSQVSEAALLGDRENLLNRIAELERQRNSMEAQRDQAFFAGAAAAERQAPVVENRSMPVIPERNSVGAASPLQHHQESAMQLTEALLCQMRASNAAENDSQSGVSMSRESEAFGATLGAPPAAPRHLDALAGSMLGPAAAMAQRPMDLQDGYAAGSAAAATRGPEGAAPSEVAQIYQELERMEMELRKVRDENSRLRDDKEACEAAHARDVTSLEAMLSQMMEENRRVAKALSDAESTLNSAEKRAVNGSPSAVNPIRGLDDKIVQTKKLEGIPLSPCVSIRSEAEPAIEPDIERSSEFDRSRLVLGAR